MVKQEIIPFTLQQAEVIVKEFQFLIGMDFRSEGLSAGHIEKLVIVPIKEISQRHAGNITISSHLSASTNISQSGLYDVYLFARSRANQERWVKVDIRSYLLKRNFILKPQAFDQHWDAVGR
jgi:hypothetical protein